MRPILSAIALVLSSVVAAAADPLPPGWTPRDDGAFVHQASGTVCPTELAGLKRTSLDPGTPPILGVCTYSDGARNRGAIRVRTYVPGEGETPMAIANDRRLMEPGSNAVSAMRMPPVPEENGVKMLRLVSTIARNGMLIDCDSTYPWTDPLPDFKTSFGNLCARQFYPK